MATTLHRVRTVWSGATGLPGYTNTYFSDAFQAQAQVDAVRDAWTVLIADLQTSLTATVEGAVMTLDTASGQFTGVTPATARTVDFTNAGQALPLQVQGLIFMKTGLFVNGRNLSGRWFIPGWTEADNTGGAPVSNAILKMINVGQTLLASGLDWHVYSPTHHVSAAVASVSSPTHWGGLVSRRQ